MVVMTPAIHCDTTEYQTWRAVAIFMLVLFIIIIPASIIRYMYPFRSMIINENHGNIHTTESTKSLNRFLEIWGVLFEPYKPRYWFWEIGIILMRRIVMISLHTGLMLYPMYEYLVFTWFHAITWWIQWRLHPFVEKFDNQLEIISISILMMLSSILIVIQTPYTDLSSQIVIFLLFPLPALVLLSGILSKRLRQFCEKHMITHSDRSILGGRTHTVSTTGIQSNTVMDLPSKDTPVLASTITAHTYVKTSAITSILSPMDTPATTTTSSVELSSPVSVATVNASTV